eukprot:TRINITY_DN100666_c0_g1_i1.p1 TRINITY_DN100666_c0_g1~~TRINITY_DN100666_c0_g1_i1.p1  ORF type:complete len:265 (-),score=30.47 TRINITY_DN100666_c0_g1_i1:679-1473(-)
MAFAMARRLSSRLASRQLSSERVSLPWASRMSSFVNRYALSTGMFVAGVKGAGADATSQIALHKQETYDFDRTATFGIWSGCYCGGLLYILYSRVFPWVLPLTTAAGQAHPHRLAHVIAMICIDNFISTPFFFMPSYYVVREGLRNLHDEAAWQEPVKMASHALQTYRNEFWSCMLLSWGMWIPIHCATFSVVPTLMRVHFTSVCSFFTLAMTSSLQTVLEKKRAGKIEASFSADGDFISWLANWCTPAPEEGVCMHAPAEGVC